MRTSSLRLNVLSVEQPEFVLGGRGAFLPTGTILADPVRRRFTDRLFPPLKMTLLDAGAESQRG